MRLSIQHATVPHPHRLPVEVVDGGEPVRAELLTELVRTGGAHRLEYRGRTYLVRRPVGEASDR